MRRTENDEFEELMVTMQLCETVHQGSRRKLRECAYRIRRRMQTERVRALCFKLANTTDPAAVLAEEYEKRSAEESCLENY